MFWHIALAEISIMFAKNFVFENRAKSDNPIDKPFLLIRAIVRVYTIIIYPIVARAWREQKYL